jgi:hypothetical protein
VETLPSRVASCFADVSLVVLPGFADVALVLAARFTHVLVVLTTPCVPTPAAPAVPTVVVSRVDVTCDVDGAAISVGHVDHPRPTDDDSCADMRDHDADIDMHLRARWRGEPDE